MQAIHIKINDEIVKELDNFSKKTERSRAGSIRIAIKKLLEEDKNEQRKKF